MLVHVEDDDDTAGIGEVDSAVQLSTEAEQGRQPRIGGRALGAVGKPALQVLQLHPADADGFGQLVLRDLFHAALLRDLRTESDRIEEQLLVSLDRHATTTDGGRVIVCNVYIAFMSVGADSEALRNPIINVPYDIPARHFVIGPSGPTGEIDQRRRPSESFIPVPAARKGAAQEALDFDITRERRERNDLVNELRREVGRWRESAYNRATPISKKLLTWWASEDRVLFCQREAAETAIFLAEVAGRYGFTDWRRRLDEANDEYNSALPRIALKMATGSGKTVVMAMLIAWQTANKVQSPRDARFAKRFLVVAPGVTIRDRLRVLQPADPGNYYDERDLVPPDLRSIVNQAQIVVTNEHAFELKTQSVAPVARAILRGGTGGDPFVETPEAMVSRVLRAFGASRDQIVIFNDEAHHCYQDRPFASKLSKDEQEANATARRWFRGLQAVQRKLGIKSIYDMSATPYFLNGSGYPEGYIFPWVVSDFSLMDAIESGVVKIPRLPVDDDATGDIVTYLRLWDHIGTELPKRKPASLWTPPKELEGALESLYRSYKQSFERWQAELADSGEPPPVFIVVCPNTVVSRLVFDWIASPARPLPLLSNTEEGAELRRPRTVLIDSAQLESGEAIKGEFKDAATSEIDAFKAELRRRRDPGVDPDKLTDEDLLREVMNTVGKKGRLGGDVRCVVSVAMLTEGWDANTVTHILGIRAFHSQLLCEQVVGRGLRRRSYALDPATRMFEPEYANVYGIPFQFIPSDRSTPEAPPRPPAALVESVPGREHLRITFPRLDGYRVEIPDEPLIFDRDDAPRFTIGASTVPTTTSIEGIVGADEVDASDPSRFRTQQIAYALAARLLKQPSLITSAGDERPWDFGELVRGCRAWLENCVDVEPGYSLGHLMSTTEWQFEAVECIERTVSRIDGGRERLRPMLRRFEPVGSTADVSFVTRKRVEPAEKSEVSHVTLDGQGGNTWEQLAAAAFELDARVHAYVKNDHLGFEIPYLHKGRSHAYLPDFLVRLVTRPGDVERTLIVEVSGGLKSPGPTRAKADTARNQWCAAVNNHGGFGRWGYIEITSMDGIRAALAEAISLLYVDAPITGDPDLIDYAGTRDVAS